MMKFSLFIINLILFLFAAINCQQDDYFSSLVRLEKLAAIESAFITKLNEIADEISGDDGYVKIKLNYWKEEHSILSKDLAKYVENPLNALGMIKRATADISLLMKRLPSWQYELARYRIKDLSLTAAVRSLLLVQRIYKLSSSDIARGYIKDRQIGDAMTPHDIYIVGMAASNLTNEEYFAKKYLEMAYLQLKDGHDVYNEIDEKELLMKIANLCERMNDYKCSAYYMKQLLTIDPENVQATQYALKIIDLFKEFGTTKVKIDHPYEDKLPKDGIYSPRKELKLISDVCRGKLTTTSNIMRLKCRYVSSSPFTKIAPLKMEEVHLNPNIVMYLNVLSNDEIQSLKKATMRNNNKKMAATDEKSIFDVVRMASLYDDNNELATRISRRIEDMTGLSVNAMEPLNVENFGVSGPVWGQRDQQHKSNKMAMLLFYMNDDHMGGHTVFPYLKVRIIPREGSALFWYTLNNFGQREYGTRFTQCPVLYKSKWIAYKSIYENGQEFKRPCQAGSFVPTNIDDYDKKVF